MAKLTNGKHRRFAELVGIGSGVLGDIVGQRQTKPGFDVTTKILRAIPELRPEWLLLGEGEMFKSDTPDASLKNISAPAGPPPEFYIEPDTSGNKLAPYLTYKTAANYAGYQSQEQLRLLDFISLPREFMTAKRPYFGFPVTGESMEPTFYTGDIVLVHQVRREAWLDLKGENLMVVVSRSNGIQLKRVTVSQELRVLHCRSDNKLYVPFPLSLDDRHGEPDVVELWMVEWRFTRRNDAPEREQAERFHTLETQMGDMRYLLESLLDEKERARRLRERDNQPDQDSPPAE